MDIIRKTIRRQYDFNESERRAIIEEYLNGTESRIAVWRKHTGKKLELTYVNELTFRVNSSANNG